MKVGDLVECIEADSDGWLEVGKRYTVQSVGGRLVRVGTEVDSWYQRRFKVVEETAVRKKLSEMEPGDRFFIDTREYRFIGECNGGWAVQTPLGNVSVWEGDVDYEVASAPKARPFANGEEFAPHREKWFQWKDRSDRKFRVVDYDDKWIQFGGSPMVWGVAFELVVFEDGSPFGVVDSVYNGGE